MSQALNLTRVVSVMLGVRDLEASTRFYTETLGLKPTLQSPQIVLLDAGSITLGLSPGHARLAAQNADPKDPSPRINGATEVVLRRGRHTLRLCGITRKRRDFPE